MKKQLFIIIGALIIIIVVIICMIVINSIQSGFHEVQIELQQDYSELFTKEEMQNKGHIQIIPELVSDTSIGFQNLDGTKSLYVYASPVHFLNKNGEWEMIDTRITNVEDEDLRGKGYIYQVVSNDIMSFFPKVLSKGSGILLQKNTVMEFGIQSENRVSPYYEEHKNFIGDNINMLVYKNIFHNIDIRMYPSSVGVNCEIYFRKKPKQNSINFWIKVENDHIDLSKQGGDYIIIKRSIDDTADDVILGLVQVPLLRNKSGNVSYNNNMISRPLGNNTYELVFSFDSKYLDAGSTAFLSFEMRREKQPDNAIYSQRPEMVDSYLKNYSVIGHSFDYGIGQLLIRYQLVKKFGLDANDIIKAQYYTYSITDMEDSYELCPMLEDWCSLSGTWNNHYQSGEAVSTSDLKDHILIFDITEEVIRWCDYKSIETEEMGFKMKSIDEKEGIYNIILSNDNSLYKNRTVITLK